MEIVKFFSFDKPALKSGQYTLEATQNLSLGGQQVQTPISAKQKLAISGNRWHINPQELVSVFPPVNSLGDHANTLPHVMFKRSTLPWEWAAGDSREEFAWMAILLLHEDEHPVPVVQRSAIDLKFPKHPQLWQNLCDAGWLHASHNDSEGGIEPKTQRKPLPDPYANLKDSIVSMLDTIPPVQNVTLVDLAANRPVGGTIQWPPIELEIFESPDNKTQVMHLSKSFLKSILPRPTEWDSLSHVRQTTLLSATGNATPKTKPFSTVIGNRMPIAGEKSTAYLVSLESRLDAGGNFDFKEAKDTDLIKLVVLHSWSFSCLDEHKTFDQLLSKLNSAKATKDSFTLRLPASNPKIEPYLSQGYSPLKHTMREGSVGISWYKGPFSACNYHGKDDHLQNSDPDAPLVQHSDALNRYDRELKMMDVSYSSAWELGRMLLLSEKDLGVKLNRWKHSSKLLVRQQEDNLVYQHLPITKSPDSLPFPEDVKTYLEELRLCKHIPFSYLVPDNRMLPPESLHFFELDEKWMESIVDGAFSIGRVSYNNQDTIPFTPENPNITGVIMRSEVVSGWPGLMVEGYAARPNPETAPLPKALPILRMERISPNVLLVLFKGTIQTVDFHLKPEALHFGFDGKYPDFTHEVRDQHGNESGKPPFSVAWRTPEQTPYLLDIETLQSNISGGTDPAIFAFQMIEGVPKVRFINGASPGG